MANSKGALWVSLFIDRNTTVCVDSFGTEYISQEVLIKIKHKSINQKISKIQSDDSIFGFFCIVFIEYMVEGKNMLHYISSFSPNDLTKNDKIIHKYFKDKYYKRRPKP